MKFTHHGIHKYDKHINIYIKNKHLLLMRHDQISNVKISKPSASSKSEHLKNEKKEKHTKSFPLSPIFEIQTDYK